MPKQNRPVVRDGRLQPARKRTDRSYLGGSPAKVAPPPDEVLSNPADVPEDAGAEPDMVADVVEDVAEAAPRGSAAASIAAMPAAQRVAQPQGQRRRREIDVDALARADARYALHELRRIALFAALVLITLIVLAFLLR